MKSDYQPLTIVTGRADSAGSDCFSSWTENFWETLSAAFTLVDVEIEDEGAEIMTGTVVDAFATDAVIVSVLWWGRLELANFSVPLGWTFTYREKKTVLMNQEINVISKLFENIVYKI